MSLENPDTYKLVNIKPERHRGSSHLIHPYFGKLDPALARILIEKYSNEGDTILDPFCGSGTVLHEALITKRSVIGWDSSALAVLLSTAKLLGLAEKEKCQLEDIVKEILGYSEQGSLIHKQFPNLSRIPPMPRVRDISNWFAPNAIKELAFLRAYLDTRLEKLLPATQILILTAFSRIIISASNQEGESSYRRVDKSDKPGRIINLFLSSLNNVIKTTEKFSYLMKANGKDNRTGIKIENSSNEFCWQNLKVNIFQHDARSIEIPGYTITSQANLVVSSPPYLMSWDYGLYHKFRFYWLGFDLDSYEETEIGRHLRRKKDDIERYESDMTSVFHSLSKALTSQAYVILINAPSIVYGTEVDTNKLLEKCGNLAGWKLIDCVPSLAIPGPHHGMYASLKPRGAKAPGEKGKREHVLIFQRHSA